MVDWVGSRLGTGHLRTIFGGALLLVAICFPPSASAANQSFEAGYYGKAAGVPRATAEKYLEIQARAGETGVVADLEASLKGSYAGIWFDPAAGEYVIPTASGNAEGAVRREMAAARLASTYRTHRVRYSWNELQTAQGELNLRLEAFFTARLVYTSLDPRANAVVLHVAADADGSDRAALKQIARSIGAEVELRTENASRFAGSRSSCSPQPGAMNCSTPFRGGVEISPFGRSPVEGGTCTAGFRAIGANGSRYVITADHCNANRYSPGEQWQAWDEQKLLKWNYWGETHYLGYVEQVSNFPSSDWTKINANGTVWDTWSQPQGWPSMVVYWPANRFERPAVDEEYEISGEAQSVVGQGVCHSGIASGTSCGEVTELNVTYDFGEPGPPGAGLVKVKGGCYEAGDSGGPYFAANIAYGIHIGSDDGFASPCNTYAFYHEITAISADLGVSVGGKSPAAETGDALEVGDSQALLTGTIHPNGGSTSFRFEYGPSTSYGKSIPVPNESAGSGSSPVVVSKTITGLAPRSHYHYRLVATNQFGTHYGPDRTFTTGVKWLVRNSNSAGGADNTAWLGLPGNYKVSGDWNGDGVETPGSYNPVTGMWRLSNSLSKNGQVDMEFQYGGSPWGKAVAGDWNGDGTDTIGVYDPTAGNWNLRDSNSSGGANHAFQFGGGAWEIPVAGDWNKDGVDTIGVYDPTAGNWNLRDSNSSGGANHAFQYGGGVFERAVAGDWNGDGTDTIGVYDPTAGNWNLRNSNTTGGPDISFQFGGSKFGTVVGDWDGNGTETVALTDDDATVERNWLLRNSNSAGGADLGYFFGLPGQIGVVGDWNGDGFKTLGSFDPGTGTWRLTNTNSSSKAELEFQYGGSGAKPVVGNWDGVGADGIGVYYPSSGNWDLRECVCGGSPNYSFGFGGGPWSNPVAGDWNKDGVDTIGVYDPTAGNWNLRDSNSSGGANHAFQFGGGAWETGLAGDWNGDGTDTIGVFDREAGNWNLRDSNSSGGANHAFQFGGSSFQPVVGDWDGSGTVTAGLIADYGEVATQPKPPVVATQAASGVTESGKATLNGTVNPNGFATRYRFEWGATTSYGNSVPVKYASAGLGNSPAAVSEQITGLLGGTTYHYRLVAESAEGKQVGADKAFETPAGDGTAERLSEMTVSEPFNGGAASIANFNSNWAKLGWAAGKGEDTASGWRSSASYPAVQGAFGNTTLSDEKGAAVVATMATNPGSAERGFSLWLDVGSATSASRNGYELRFTYVSSNTYSVALSKWSTGTKTSLVSKGSVSFANGNSLALVDKGSSVSGWVNTGSGYSELLSASDSTFASGNAGIEAAGSTTRLTNFRLGSVLPNTTSEPGTTTAWNLRYSNTTGVPDLSVQFGLTGQKEVVGDWNGDGISTLGTFDASSGTWKLRNANGPGPAEIVVQFGGGAYNTPIVGDWNGDGIDTIGVFDPSGRNWSLRNSNFAGSADQSFQYGGSGAKPVVGNWDGVGADGIGVYYSTSGNWDLRECVCGGSPNYSFQFGGGPWIKPIAGNWDGVGADGIGVYDPTAGNWNLRHCMCGGNPDYSFQYGGGAWATPVVGDWKGNGTDTVAVAND